MECPECGAWVSIQSDVRKAFNKMPIGSLELFEVCGQDVFPIYCGDGGVSMREVFYLISKMDNEGIYCLPIWNTSDIDRVMEQAFVEFPDKAHLVKKGGSLGLPKEEMNNANQE